MNGWKNYETWNVASWIAKDERLYHLALDCKSFTEFRERLWIFDRYAGRNLSIARETPDGVSWNDPQLDLPAINAWFFYKD